MTRGNLLLGGPKGVRGRVVDDKMLNALCSGCLLVGVHSKQAFYTLERVFSVQNQQLKDTYHSLFGSSDGIKLCKAGMAEINTIRGVVDVLISNRLQYHKSIKRAVQALEQAGNMTAPTIEERVFQVAIGGDIDSLMMGKFLPCDGCQHTPDVNIRCACGFQVEGRTPTKEEKELLRSKCKKT